MSNFSQAPAGKKVKKKVAISKSCIAEYYRFNPACKKGGLYSKSLDKIYKKREQWNARCPVVEEGRDFFSYLAPKCYPTREAWDNDAIFELNEKLFGIAIHHSGNSGMHSMSEVQNKHIDVTERADIGYHFGVDLKGNVFEGRPIGVRGSHLNSYNTGVIGIVLLADLDHSILHKDFGFGSDEISMSMLKNLFILIRSLKEQFPNISQMGGHKEWPHNKDRYCPGEYGLEYVKALRKQLKFSPPK